MLEVFDERVGTRKEQSLVAIVAPPHEVRRTSVLALDLQDLGVTVGLADVVTLDDQPVTRSCTHHRSSSLGASTCHPSTESAHRNRDLGHDQNGLRPLGSGTNKPQQELVFVVVLEPVEHPPVLVVSVTGDGNEAHRQPRHRDIETFGREDADHVVDVVQRGQVQCVATIPMELDHQRAAGVHADHRVVHPAGSRPRRRSHQRAGEDRAADTALRD